MKKTTFRYICVDGQPVSVASTMTEENVLLSRVSKDKDTVVIRAFRPELDAFVIDVQTAGRRDFMQSKAVNAILEEVALNGHNQLKVA